MKLRLMLNWFVKEQSTLDNAGGFVSLFECSETQPRLLLAEELHNECYALGYYYAIKDLVTKVFGEKAELIADLRPTKIFSSHYWSQEVAREKNLQTWFENMREWNELMTEISAQMRKEPIQKIDVSDRPVKPVIKAFVRWNGDGPNRTIVEVVAAHNGKEESKKIVQSLTNKELEGNFTVLYQSPVLFNDEIIHGYCIAIEDFYQWLISVSKLDDKVVFLHPRCVMERHLCANHESEE